jgi:hypothetical protein
MYDMHTPQFRLTVPVAVVPVHAGSLHHDLWSIAHGRVRPAVRPTLQMADIQVCKCILQGKER